MWNVTANQLVNEFWVNVRKNPKIQLLLINVIPDVIAQLNLWAETLVKGEEAHLVSLSSGRGGGGWTGEVVISGAEGRGQEPR